jgi:hypothetical protein
MDENTKDKKANDKEVSVENRRKVLRSLGGAAGVLGAATQVPEKWTRPVVDSVMLPAHAQTSPAPSTTSAPPTTQAPLTATCCIHYTGNGGFNAFEVTISEPVDGIIVTMNSISVTKAGGCTPTVGKADNSTNGFGRANWGAGEIDNDDCLGGTYADVCSGEVVISINISIAGGEQNFDCPVLPCAGCEE